MTNGSKSTTTPTANFLEYVTDSAPAVSSVSSAPMGIQCDYVRLSPAELQRSLDDPAWAQEHIDELGDAWAEEELPPEKALYFSIEKSWHMLHFLISAHGRVPVDVIQGGVELPLPDQLDYGPARYLTPEDVAEATRFLAATPFDDLVPHYDVTAMRTAEIYLVPGAGSEAADLEYLRHHYDQLTRFLSATASTGDAVALMLT